MDCEVQVIPPGSVRADQENGPLWERLDRQAVKASLELLRLDVEVTQDVMYTDPDLEEVPGVKSQRQGQVGAARRLQKRQKDMLERILADFEGLYEVMDSDYADHSDVELYQIWQREMQMLHVACRACRSLTARIDQVFSTTPKSTLQRFVSNQYRNSTYSLIRLLFDSRY